MYETGAATSNLGKGISSLAGQAEENRQIGGSGYQQDYAAVHEYNQLMKQLKDQNEKERRNSMAHNSQNLQPVAINSQSFPN